MSEVKKRSAKTPAPKAESTIRLFGSAPPCLEAGSHLVTVTQRVKIDGNEVAGTDASFSCTLNITIEGPGDRLDPNLIQGTYPPPDDEGGFATTLPHLVLREAVWPWIRSAGTVGQQRLPWLALLIFHPGDKDVVWAESEGGRRRVTLPGALFKEIVPTASELSAFVHVQEVAPPSDGNGTPKGQRFSVIVAKRFAPETGRATACLVSLEGLASSLGTAPAKAVSLTVLHSWTFTCKPNAVDPQRDFKSIAGRIALRSLSMPSAADPATAGLAAAGFVVLPHRLRGGTAMTSWYRGPLIPLPPRPDFQRKTGLGKGSADSLLACDSGGNKLVTGTAAAWQLGRLLALSDAEAAQAIHRWKIGTTRPSAPPHPASATAEAEQKEFPKALAAVAALSRTMAKSDRVLQDGDSDDRAVLADFLNRLYRLEGVPLAYLLPSPDLLPTESLAIFHVDPAWTAALVDGALAIGGSGPIEGALGPAGEAARRDGLIDELVRAAPATGFVLRSTLLTFYPGIGAVPLLPRGKAKGEAGKGRDDLVSGEWLRLFRPVPDLMIGLAGGVLKGVRLEEPAEAQSFTVGQRPATGIIAPDSGNSVAFAKKHRKKRRFLNFLIG